MIFTQKLRMLLDWTPLRIMMTQGNLCESTFAEQSASSYSSSSSTTLSPVPSSSPCSTFQDALAYLAGWTSSKTSKEQLEFTAGCSKLLISPKMGHYMTSLVMEYNYMKMLKALGSCPRTVAQCSRREWTGQFSRFQHFKCLKMYISFSSHILLSAISHLVCISFAPGI